MMQGIKRILGSRWFRFFLSIVLVYFAFRKIDIVSLLAEIKSVPVHVVVLLLLFMLMMIFIGGIRWSYLVLPNPKWSDYWAFTKATYLGSFYGLFFPSAVGGDLLKWTSLSNKYPGVTRTKLLSSVLIDRIIGFTAFVITGLVALVAGKILGYKFPDFILWLFLGLNAGVGGFYVLVFTLDFEKIFGKFKILTKVIEMVGLLKNENKGRILKCFLISMVAEPVWQLPFWFYSLIFNAGISLLQVYIFVPVITLILVLPISVAGFGARENLFLFFFSQLGIADSKILAVSTFGGIINVLNSAIGGLFLLFK